jgi:putative oxidoreductase
METNVIDLRFAPLAVFLLRIALGAMFLAHSLVLKLFVYTLPGTAGFFASLGLPGWSAYLVFAAEAAGGLMLLLGIQARWVALALVPILAGATWAHWGNGWMFGYPNGGWEYPLYLTLLAFVQFLLGDGAFAPVRSWRLERAHGTTNLLGRQGA